MTLTKNRAMQLLPQRRTDSNKGTYGKLLIFAGKKECAGCAILSALAALRSGLGMVKVISDESVFVPLMNVLPESLFSSDTDTDSLEEDTDWADTILIGPGTGKDERAARLLEFVLGTRGIPAVIDADGINLLSSDRSLRKKLKEKTKSDEVILTPHLMEMSRFTGIPVSDIKEDMPGVAADAAEDYGAVFALKDAVTVTASPKGEVVINTTGNNGMSTAGSGDVLSGIVSSFKAQGLGAFTSAALGVYIHGAAGDKAAEKYGVRSMKAMDIAESLAAVLKDN